MIWTFVCLQLLKRQGGHTQLLLQISKAEKIYPVDDGRINKCEYMHHKIGILKYKPLQMYTYLSIR